MMQLMKKIGVGVVGLVTAVPSLVWAGGGEKVDQLVIVADTRVISNSFVKYIADLYNTNTLLFAVWAVVLTALYGAFLGFFMDFLMARTGLDLKSRKIVEH